MNKLNTDSFLARLLARLARAVFHRRAWFVYPQIVLCFLCIGYTVKFLKFDTSRNDLVGGDKKYHQNFLQFREEFPAQDDLVVVVESENPEKNRQFVERLGAKLEAETNRFHHVVYRRDLKLLGAKALLFVPEADLVELQQRLRDFQPFVERFTRTTNLVSLFNMINTQFRTAKQERNDQTESLVKALPALEHILNQATESLKRPGSPPSPEVMALFSGGPETAQDLYITFGGGRIYLLTAQPPSKDQNRATVLRLRELIEETRVEVTGVNAGLTGESVLETDEMVQSQKDTTLASIVALTICAIIFIYGYNETGRPLKATLCLLVGLAYTMAYTTLVVGHLNILTITFVPILIGLAIDFGVHLVTRYEEELRHGRSEEAAITKALVFTGQGIFTGAFTTAGAFLAMWFTDFKGIQEMGIICGGGLLVCLIPMLTLLPALLLRGRQNVLDHERGDQPSRRERIEKLWLQRPVTVTVLTLALCVLGATQFRKIYFDYNLLNMQSASLPAVVFEEKLIYSATNSHPAQRLFREAASGAGSA
jgi:predicted RND superfamily exporter protein